MENPVETITRCIGNRDQLMIEEINQKNNIIKNKLRAFKTNDTSICKKNEPLAELTRVLQKRQIILQALSNLNENNIEQIINSWKQAGDDKQQLMFVVFINDIITILDEFYDVVDDKIMLNFAEKNAEIITKRTGICKSFADICGPLYADFFSTKIESLFNLLYTNGRILHKNISWSNDKDKYDDFDWNDLHFYESISDSILDSEDVDIKTNTDSVVNMHKSKSKKETIYTYYEKEKQKRLAKYYPSHRLLAFLIVNYPNLASMLIHSSNNLYLMCDTARQVIKYECMKYFCKKLYYPSNVIQLLYEIGQNDKIYSYNIPYLSNDGQINPYIKYVKKWIDHEINISITDSSDTNYSDIDSNDTDSSDTDSSDTDFGNNDIDSSDTDFGNNDIDSNDTDFGNNNDIGSNDIKQKYDNYKNELIQQTPEHVKTKFNIDKKRTILLQDLEKVLYDIIEAGKFIEHKNLYVIMPHSDILCNWRYQIPPIAKEYFILKIGMEIFLGYKLEESFITANFKLVMWLYHMICISTNNTKSYEDEYIINYCGNFSLFPHDIIKIIMRYLIIKCGEYRDRPLCISKAIYHL